MKAPGVYLEEVFPQPEVSLATGAPGFIGFATANSPENQKDGVVQLYRKEELHEKLNFPKEEGYLQASVIGFFDNGGTYCYVAFPDPNISKQNALKKAIEALGSLTNIDLVAVPDAMTLLEPDDIYDVQNAVIKHCEEHGGRLAILDGCRDSKSVQEQREKIAVNQTGSNATLYYPWIQVKSPNDDLKSPNDDSLKPVPPCGHIAGIFARSDRVRGVFKAPANEAIRGAIGLEASISDTEQAELNTQGINCLRAFPGRGIRVWGARTLSPDLNWRYINIRRLFLTTKRWIDLNMAWAAFEPNTPQLWVRIQRELSVYLTQLWQAGGLKGETPEQAFYIRCDAETNPVENREIGQVMTEIGLAPAAPAEFIVVQLTHRAGTTEMT